MRTEAIRRVCFEVEPTHATTLPATQHDPQPAVFARRTVTLTHLNPVQVRMMDCNPPKLFVVRKHMYSAIQKAVCKHTYPATRFVHICTVQHRKRCVNAYTVQHRKRCVNTRTVQHRRRFLNICTVQYRRRFANICTLQQGS
jgi:hypothetical protein